MAERNRGLFIGFMTARWQREKDPPSLRSVIAELDEKAQPEPPREQTPEEMAAAFDAIVLMTGGTLGESPVPAAAAPEPGGGE